MIRALLAKTATWIKGLWAPRIVPCTPAWAIEDDEFVHVTFRDSPPIPRRSERKSNPLTLQRQQTREDAGETGAFNDVHAVVRDAKDRLACLRKMKWPQSAHYKDVAAYCRAVGTFVVGPETRFPVDSIVLPFRPSLLIASLSMYGLDKAFETEHRKRRETAGDGGNILMDYMYLMKLTRAETAKLGVFRDVVYEMGFGSPGHMVWPSLWHWGCYVKVTPSGAVSQMYGTMRQKVTVGRRRNTYESQYWGAMALPTDHGHPWPECFATIMNAACMRDSHWSITVSDDHNKVTYSVPQNDAPRMFRARDKDGTRIFHAVAAHIRKDGAVVRQHYRGNRKFVLDGLDVTVQIPGHHRSSLIFTPEFVEPGDNTPTIPMTEASEKMGSMMER